MISVLTYDRAHRRTQDVLIRLKSHGHQDVNVVAVPWIDSKTPPFRELFEWRPSKPYMETTTMARNFGYQYIPIKSYLDLLKGSWGIIIVGGARVIDPEVVNKITIINSHPAMLPHNRGLDTMKWAIWYGDPIGVTVYVMNDLCDTGQLIHQELTPLELNDN
jgi:hypothetical protein